MSLLTKLSEKTRIDVLKVIEFRFKQVTTSTVPWVDWNWNCRSNKILPPVSAFVKHVWHIRTNCIKMHTQPKHNEPHRALKYYVWMCLTHELFASAAAASPQTTPQALTKTYAYPFRTTTCDLRLHSASVSSATLCSPTELISKLAMFVRGAKHSTTRDRIMLLLIACSLLFCCSRGVMCIVADGKLKDKFM